MHHRSRDGMQVGKSEVYVMHVSVMNAWESLIRVDGGMNLFGMSAPNTQTQFKPCILPERN